jgi:hypothetical protein
MSISKKIIIIFVFLVVAGVGFLVYTKFRSSGQPNQESISSSENSADEIRQKEFEGAIKKASGYDQDLDGIPDSEEAKYKTSPTSSDTDGDGLTDYEEIFNFKTDPLKADTDGDGYTDGYEVRHGTDPNKKN